MPRARRVEWGGKQSEKFMPQTRKDEQIGKQPKKFVW
jgi:hypothetical protein